MSEAMTGKEKEDLYKELADSNCSWKPSDLKEAVSQIEVYRNQTNEEKV